MWQHVSLVYYAKMLVYVISQNITHNPVHPNTGKKQIYISTNQAHTVMGHLQRLTFIRLGNGLLLNNIFYLNNRANVSQSSLTNTQIEREG